MNDFQVQDQSQFSDQEPLLAPAYQRPKGNEVKQEMKGAWYKNRILILFSFISLALLLLFGVLMILRNGPMSNQLIDPDELVDGQLPLEVTTLQIRVNNLRVQLDQADPARSDLPYPPIDPKLKLD